MKIAWFTPFAADSALAAHSAGVAAALGAHDEVEIWTDEGGPLHASEVPVIRFAGEEYPRGCDAVFHNLDGAVSEAARRHGGILILHRGPPPALPRGTLGVLTHSPADARGLARSRLEPVRALNPRPIDAYAAALVEFVAEVQRATPALALLERIADELATMRAAPGLTVFDTIAADFGRFLVL